MKNNDNKPGKVVNRVSELEEIKKQKDSGKVFALPFENYPKLSESVPGVVPGMITCVTAASGVGKTQFTKALFVREPLEYAMKHGINLKILYFALEESKQEFIDTMICNYISEKCNIDMDVLMLQGYRDKSLDQFQISMIKKHMYDIETLLERVEIVDSVYNPTGIYKYCRDHADRNGAHHYKDKVFITKENGVTNREIKKVYSHYISNDPNAFTIVVVDHISLLKREIDKDTKKKMTLHETMAYWSTNYCLKQLTKHWNWAVINIQQQEQSGEKEQFTNSGQSIVKKTMPSLAGLANNKELQRDYKVVFGVYSPDRHGFESFGGHDIRRFRDKYRCVTVLKNRFGSPNKNHSFLFNGATNTFVELPVGQIMVNGAKKTNPEILPFHDIADVLNGRKLGKVHPNDRVLPGPKNPVKKNFGKTME